MKNIFPPKATTMYLLDAYLKDNKKKRGGEGENKQPSYQPSLLFNKICLLKKTILRRLNDKYFMDGLHWVKNPEKWSNIKINTTWNFWFYKVFSDNSDQYPYLFNLTPRVILSYQLKGTFTSAILKYFVFELRNFETNMSAESHFVLRTQVDWTSKKCCLTVQTVAKRSGESYRPAPSNQIRPCQLS